MLIIGCDYHPGFQQLRSWIPRQGSPATTADSPGRSRAVLPGMKQRAEVRVGMESSGHARWFERLLVT